MGTGSRLATLCAVAIAVVTVSCGPGTDSYSADDAGIICRYTDLPARIDMSEVQRLAA